MRTIVAMDDQVPNPLVPAQSLKRPLEEEQLEEAHPPQPILPEDSAVTKAEKIERNGVNGHEEPAAKKVRFTQTEEVADEVPKRQKVKGIALVKPEWVTPSSRQ